MQYVNFILCFVYNTTCSLEALKNFLFCQVDELTDEVNLMALTTPKVYIRSCVRFYSALNHRMSKRMILRKQITMHDYNN